MLHLLLIWEFQICVIQKALKDWSNKSCGLEMLQFPRDPSVSLSVPTLRVADNLVNRAPSQAVGSDDLNLPKLVQDVFHHLWWKAVVSFAHSVRKLKDVLRHSVGKNKLKQWREAASFAYPLHPWELHPQKPPAILNNTIIGASNRNSWLTN